MIPNPYESPSRSVETPAARGTWQPVLCIASSLVLLLAGLSTLLLLNGQFFTNSVIALVLITLSGLLWLGLAYDNRWKRLAMWILLIHVILVVGLLPGFGERYAAQKEFNESAEAQSKGKG